MSWVSAFSSWGWSDIAATFLVVVGVAGEVWSFFLKTQFNPTAFAFLESKKKKVEKWSLIILLAGVSIEVPATVENLKDSANSRLEAARLEAQIRPRLFQTQGEAAKRLGKFEGMNAIIVSASDAECVGAAAQICSALEMANWKVISATPSPSIMHFGVRVAGITLGPKSENSVRKLAAATALVSELNNSDIDATLTYSEWEGFSSMEPLLIVVGARPTIIEAARIKEENELDLGKISHWKPIGTNRFEIQYKTPNGGTEHKLY